MEGEQHDHEGDHPGQVDQRDRTLSGEERVDGIEIARELQAVAFVRTGAQGTRDRCVVYGLEQIVVHAIGDAEQRFVADRLEHRLERVDQQQHAEQTDQRGHAAAWQDRIVNEQHVGRTGEDQHVEHDAGDGDQNKAAAIARRKEPHELTVDAHKSPDIRRLTHRNCAIKRHCILNGAGPF